ncbi:MAG: (d)CMP kinase [Elusimicrobiales bacterium]|jgi:cytidylate kinase|nr:(d)CMP kinase [Elusimicrobiales bacterium]
MRKNGIVIALDGPAGVGKSTVGKRIASEVNYKFVSTGKMYRALAWKALQTGTALNDEQALLSLADSVSWTFPRGEGPEADVALDGKVLRGELITEEVSRASSAVAVLPGVRSLMKTMQQKAGADGGVVMEGRDIGTNIFPDAELKIFLDASAEARASRRVGQLKAQGLEADYNEILAFIKKRDYQDSTRKINPLKKADDAVYLDSTNLSQDQVVERIILLFRKAAGR